MRIVRRGEVSLTCARCCVTGGTTNHGSRCSWEVSLRLTACSGTVNLANISSPVFPPSLSELRRASRTPTPHPMGRGRGEGRLMESLHDFGIAHGDHEPGARGFGCLRMSLPVRKAALKTHALQALARPPSAGDVAKRLECGDLSTALRPRFMECDLFTAPFGSAAFTPLRLTRHHP